LKLSGLKTVDGKGSNHATNADQDQPADPCGTTDHGLHALFAVESINIVKFSIKIIGLVQIKRWINPRKIISN
jgi:hypothetical protein